MRTTSEGLLAIPAEVAPPTAKSEEVAYRLPRGNFPAVEGRSVGPRERRALDAAERQVRARGSRTRLQHRRVDHSRKIDARADPPGSPGAVMRARWSDSKVFPPNTTKSDARSAPLRPTSFPRAQPIEAHAKADRE